MSAFTGGAASVFVTRLLTFGVSLAANGIIARALGTSGKGELALLDTFTGIVLLLATPGIGAASVYFQNREGERRWEVASTAIALQLAFALGGALIASVALRMMPGLGTFAFHGELPRDIVYIALAMLPLGVFFSSVLYVVLGTNQLIAYNALTLGSATVQLVFYAVVLLFLRGNVAGVLIAAGLSSAVVALTGLRWLRGLGFRFSPSTRPVSALLGYGARGWLGTTLQFLNYRLDTLIVNHFVGVSDVGLYAVSVALAETLWHISAAASTVIFPRTASDVDAATGFTPLVARTVGLVTLGGAIAIAIGAYPMILIVFGRDFLPAVPSVLGLLPGIVMLAVGKVLSNDLAGRGRPEFGSWSAGAALVGTIAFDFLLIPRWGFMGAAAASSISYSVSAIVLVVCYARVTGNSVASVLFPQRGDLQLYREQIARLQVKLLAGVSRAGASGR
jgi:O-antigen/teichoic acid export membrane protein